jgi:NAD(P)-dependent dehydrogenase (short-subunit alcohol dehydrogenase family)
VASTAASKWSIEGKVALVTGAGAGGTGRAIAARLARGGAAVVVDDLDEDGGTATVRLIQEAGGRAIFVRADVTSETDIERMVAVAERTFGGLDILVNNAGAAPRPYFPEAPREHWGRTLDLNLRGPMHAIQEALASMRKRGGGAIVNISSVAGHGYAPHSSPEYAAAKAGLARLTATLAPLHERENVRVNCIVPSWIGTEQVLTDLADMSPEERAEVPEVLTAPEAIADLVVELIEDPTAAGRVFVWWTGRPPEPMPIDGVH